MKRRSLFILSTPSQKKKSPLQIFIFTGVTFNSLYCQQVIQRYHHRTEKRYTIHVFTLHTFHVFHLPSNVQGNGISVFYPVIIFLQFECPVITGMKIEDLFPCSCTNLFPPVLRGVVKY